MNKVLLTIFVILMLMPIVYATQIIQINVSTPLIYEFSFNNTLVNVTSVSASILNVSGNTIVSYLNAPAVPNTTGTYYYNFTPNSTGNYIVYFNTTYLGNQFIASDDILVVNNINSIAQDTTNMIQIIFQTFLIFLVPFLLAVLAQYTRNELLFIFSGVWFLGSSADLAFAGVSWATWSFFALLGLYFIYHGTDLILQRNEINKKKKELNPEFESDTN